MAKKNKLAPECNSSDAFVIKTENNRAQKINAKNPQRKSPAKKTTLSAASNSGGKTKEMIERDKRNRKKQKAIKKAENMERRHLNKIPLHIFFTILIYIFIAGIIVAVAGLYVLPHFGIDGEIMYRYDVFLNGKRIDDDTILKTWSRANGGGAVNVNMSLLSKLCDIATTGNNHSIRYTVKDSGEYMEFYPGSSECCINNRQVRMSGPSVYDDEGALYVPIDFVQNYVSGVNVTYNESTFRVETYYVENDVISFGISHAPQTNEEIIFTSLDYELQEEIIAASTPSDPIFDFVE